MLKLYCIHKVGEFMEETKIYDSTVFKDALIGNIVKEVITIVSE